MDDCAERDGKKALKIASHEIWPRSFGEERAGTYFAYGKECIFPLCKHRHGTGTGKWDTGVEGDNKKVNDKLVEEKRTDMCKKA